MNTSFIIKSVVLTVIIISTILVANIFIFGIASFYGLPISSSDDLMQLMEQREHLVFAKLIVGINHFCTFIVAPIIFLLIFYRKNIFSYLRLRKFKYNYLILFSIALFMLYPLMGYLTFFIVKIDLPDFLTQMDDDASAFLTRLIQMNNVPDLMLNLLLVSILPGIGEELLFRGIIQREIYQKWNRPHLAIWVTAFIFAAFHFQVVGFIPKMMIGIFLGYAFYFSGSLILPMFVHSINNGFATISYFLAGESFGAEKIPAQNVPIGAVLISTVLFSILMYHIYKIYLQQSQLIEHEK